MAAISQYSNAQFEDQAEYGDYDAHPSADEFPNPNPNPNPNPDYALAAHTYTPGVDPSDDRNTAFVNAAFGHD